jgi:pimeloyl-ACP methyl ester carboxylesterase
VGRAAVLRDARPFVTFTAMSSGPAEISERERERAKLLIDALTVMSMEQVWDAMSGMGPLEETPVGGADLRRRWLATDPAQLAAAAGLLVGEPDRVEELAAVRPPLPMLVLSGDEDGIWPPTLLDDMARRLGARRTVVPDAGHSPNTDRPAETAAALIDFWRDHPGRS